MLAQPSSADGTGATPGVQVQRPAMRLLSTRVQWGLPTLASGSLRLIQDEGCWEGQHVGVVAGARPDRILPARRHFVGVSSQEIKPAVGSRKELMDAAKGETGQRREQRAGGLMLSRWE